MTHAAHAGPFQRETEAGVLYARIALQGIHETGMPSLLAKIANEVPREGALALGFFTELARLAMPAFQNSGRRGRSKAVRCLGAEHRRFQEV
jgi:hypothetical protein